MRTLKVEAAKWSADAGGEWLCLKSSHAAIMAALESIDASKKYVAEIKQERKSRSLNANAYYWRLCGELSAALRIPPNDIYRQHIRDALRTWSGCSPRCRARPVTSVCNGTMGRPERRRRRSSRRRAHAPAASFCAFWPFCCGAAHRHSRARNNPALASQNCSDHFSFSLQ